MTSVTPSHGVLDEQAEDEAPPRVEVRGLRKTFSTHGDVVAAVDGVSLTVGASEMLVLLGPSGCGKTTLLRAIAGLEEPDEGAIEIDGKLVYDSTRRLDVSPEKRGVSFVFQSYALWPHMSVLENVSYPLRATGTSTRDARDRAQEALTLVGCGGLERRFPAELSGGQQQRVALARAIVARRGLIFFDEPLSNIDAKVREKLRLELLNIRDAVGFAGIYVTHDQDEAMILGDRIAVMAGGRILQIGTPRQIYEQPATRWVADFIGLANFVEGDVVGAQDDEVELRGSLGRAFASARGGEAPEHGTRATAFFRPEWGRVLAEPAPVENAWPCSVRHTIYIGDREETIVDVLGTRFVVTATEVAEGAEGWLCVPRSRVVLVAS